MKPLPPLFWRWAAWRLGHGPWRGKGPRSKPRPAEFPWRIPARWWTAYLRMWPAKPPPPQPPVPVSYGFFQRPSCWVNHPDGANPDLLVPLMRAGGQTLAIVQVLDGLDWPGDEQTPAAEWERKTRLHMDGLRAAGIAVAGWGWGKGEWPSLEAAAAKNRVRDLRLDGYVMNGEKPYEGGGKSGEFVAEFRYFDVTRKTPLGWSPEPQLALDHHVLQREGVCYMPQAYPGENRWDVEGCVNVGLRFGYKLEQIVPLVSAHDGTPAVSHVISAHRVGVKWLCLYPTNSVMGSPDWFEELGRV